MARLYVLVRNDLSRSQQDVQAGHAVAQWMLDHSQEAKEEWGNGTIVYLTIKDEVQLVEVAKDLLIGNAGRVTSYFREPDIENQMTALACLQYGPRSEYFDKYSLL